MKKQSSSIVSYCLILVFLITLNINSNTFGQQINKISDVPGGGGSNNTNTEIESNDNTMLYLVGGAVVIGIVVYALMKDKKEKSTKDTTAVILNDNFLQKQLTLKDEVLKHQSQIPINISFGMHRVKSFSDEKRYFVGMSYNF